MTRNFSAGRMLILSAALSLLLAAAVPAEAQEKAVQEPVLSDPDSWTVVLIPDLQGYAKQECNQPIMEIMTSWIATHAERLNTKLVLCVGDLVEQNDRISSGYSGDQSSHRQWEAFQYQRFRHSPSKHTSPHF